MRKIKLLGREISLAVLLALLCGTAITTYALIIWSLHFTQSLKIPLPSPSLEVLGPDGKQITEGENMSNLWNVVAGGGGYYPGDDFEMNITIVNTGNKAVGFNVTFIGLGSAWSRAFNSPHANRLAAHENCTGTLRIWLNGGYYYGNCTGSFTVEVDQTT